MEYYIKSKSKECLPFDEWITKLEMRAFGWMDCDCRVDWLDEYDITIDWDGSKAYVKQKFNVSNVFKRIEPYGGNILFKFLEFLMNVQSWIRRKLIILLWFIDAILFGIGLLYLFNGAGMNEYIAYGIAVFAFVYAPSLIILVLGFLTRKIFRLDEKLKDRLEANGYMREQRL